MMNNDIKNLDTKCGFVTLLGAPNAGKSTLMNVLVGDKVSIVSPKVQTTRTVVRGIAIKDKNQIVFIDTPGIFKPKRRLDRAMVSAAWNSVEDSDLLAVLVDVNRGYDYDTQKIVSELKKNNKKAVLVINKIDLVNKNKILDLTIKLNDEGVFSETFMISATNKDGTKDFLDFLCSKMPKSPWFFPKEQVTDMPDRLLCAEITREKLFLKLHKEVPYATTVETDSFEVRNDNSIKIEQVIFVEKDSHKKIILGKRGSFIKSIGQEARKELEEIFQTRVHLFLFVKVRKKWGDDKERFDVWNLDFNV